MLTRPLRHIGHVVVAGVRRLLGLGEAPPSAIVTPHATTHGRSTDARTADHAVSEQPPGSRSSRRRTPSRRPKGRPKDSDPNRIPTTLHQVSNFLNSDGFAHRLREDQSAIDTGFRGHTGSFPILIAVRDNPAILGVSVRIPLIVPEKHRLAMAETIARANWGLSIGSFDLDMSDGNVGFRATMPIADAEISHEQVRDLLGAALWTVDRYHRAFGRLLFGDDLSPAEVIAEVEMDD